MDEDSIQHSIQCLAYTAASYRGNPQNLVSPSRQSAWQVVTMASANSAPCPVCGKQILLETMNSHIDLCLITGGHQLDENDAPSKTTRGKPPTFSQQNDSTATSAHSMKGSSSAPSGKGKQSVLAFGKREPPSSGSTADQPPAKSRKLASTPKSSHTTSQQPIARGSIHDEHQSRGGGQDSRSFSKPAISSSKELSRPLAELMRPLSIEDYVGQESVIGKNAILRTILESGEVPSLIFWGPPGCGKGGVEFIVRITLQTTLARIIARVARSKQGTKFTYLSATTCGVSDVKEVVKVAKNERIMLRRQTILFIDEIHRFNKLQQDAFLPHVEDGTITLLGATTENPSFQLNSALLSRCRVIVLEKLQPPEIESLLRRALPRIGAREETADERSRHGEEETGDPSSPLVLVDLEAISTLALFCDGDARSALNGLQLAVQAKRTRYLQTHCGSISSEELRGDAEIGSEIGTSSVSKEKKIKNGQGHSGDCYTSLTVAGQEVQSTSNNSMQSASLPTVTVADAKESLQRTHLLYDRAGEEHYNCISALHKSMRGSDANASLYWLARMLCAGEDPLYVARRVICFASEDVGLADPNALSQAVSAFQACQFIGMPGCEFNLAQAVVYMARAPKSIEVYNAYHNAKASVMEYEGPLPSVPLHLRNASTKLMKTLGYGKGYKYKPTQPEAAEQRYLPEELKDVDFFS